MVCISTVCGSILDDYFSAREIVAICQVLCTMPTFVSHFRGLMVSFMRLYKFALFQPWKHSFLTQEFMLRRRQFAKPLHLRRKKKKVLLPLCRSKWTKQYFYVQISLRISDPVSELLWGNCICLACWNTGRVQNEARMKTHKIPGSSLFGLTSTGASRVREYQRRSEALRKSMSINKQYASGYQMVNNGSRARATLQQNMISSGTAVRLTYRQSCTGRTSFPALLYDGSTFHRAMHSAEYYPRLRYPSICSECSESTNCAV